MTTGGNKSQSGFSLIEVLIAIAVLSIGIVAMIEVFPPGFIAINSSDLSARANAAASNCFSRNEKALSNIALIYDYDSPTMSATYAANSPSWSNAQSWNATLSTQVASSTNYSSLGINSERVVSGELATIPQLNTTHQAQTATVFASDSSGNLIVTSVGSGTCTYGLTFAPIDSHYGFPTIRGTAWTPFSLPSYDSAVSVLPPVGYMDPTDKLTAEQPQYAIDYVNHRIALPLEKPFADYNNSVRQGLSPATPTGYSENVTVTYYTSSGTYVENFTVDVTSTLFMAGPSMSNQVTGDPFYHALWFDPRNVVGATWQQVATNSFNLISQGHTAPAAMSAADPWVTGGIVLKRDFNLVTASGANSGFTIDPYQYEVDDGNISTTTPVVNLGLIHFNPRAAILRDPGNHPVKFVADYAMADTRIMCEDHPADVGSIRVDAPSILRTGDLLDLPDQDSVLSYTKLSGLIDPRSNRGTTINDPGTGKPADIFVIDLDTGILLKNGTDFTVDYGNGRVMLSDNGGSLIGSNHRLRILYRARHEWGVTVIKSASSYAYAGIYGPNNEPSDTDATTPGQDFLGHYWLDSGGTQICFPASDIGQNVELEGLNIVTSSGARTVDHGGSWTILSLNGTVGVIYLAASKTPDGNPPGLLQTGETLSTASTPIAGVSSGSVLARVTYLDSNTFRHQEVSNYLNSVSQ